MFGIYGCNRRFLMIYDKTCIFNLRLCRLSLSVFLNFSQTRQLIVDTNTARDVKGN